MYRENARSGRPGRAGVSGRGRAEQKCMNNPAGGLFISVAEAVVVFKVTGRASFTISADFKPSATLSLDRLCEEFPDVHVGIHSYDSLDGGSASFGNRSSGDISGPGSYDIESLFSLRLDGLTDSTLAFQVQPGQVRANGAAGGFATIGDFVRGTFNFDIKLGGVSVFQQVVSAVVDDNEATAVSTPLIGGGQLQRQSGQRYGQLRHRGRRLHARPRCTRSDAYRRPRPVLLAGRSSRRPHLQCQQPRQQRR